jgi:hypothetical protein
MKKIAVASIALAVLLFTAAAYAVQFDYLDPGFNQQIYTGPLVGGPGMAWSSTGNLLTRNGSDILEYNLTQVPLAHQGTNLHPQTVTHTIPGLSTTGFGLAKGLDGYIYTPTAGGLERFSTNLTSSAQSLTGTVGGQGYGATTLPDGRIVYVAGPSTNEVYVYTPNANPSLGTNTLIYTAPSLIDDIEASSTGAIALALQQINGITIISNTGSTINTLSGLPHHPDGLAFGDGVTADWLYSNNNDGSITQYQLGPGYSGTPTIVDIATQSPPPYGKAYGDLAAVGPDCAFYVTQFDNFGLNGSTSGVGTHWDNGVTNNEASIVRIAAVDPRTGVEYCGFGSATENVPEPGMVLLILTGLGAIVLHTRRLRPTRS